MELPETCPTCGANASSFMTLPDQSTFCPVCRNAVLELATVPDVVTTAAEKSRIEFGDNDGAMNDDDAQEVTHDQIAPPPTPPGSVAATGEGSVLAVPDPSPAPQDDIPTPRSDIDNDADGGPNLVLLRILIGLILRAGVMSVDADNNPVEPPTGWLPPPADSVPEVGAAAALAVAVLIRTVGIEHADVIDLANQFVEDPTEDEDA